jgi:hypothetical protein
MSWVVFQVFNAQLIEINDLLLVFHINPFILDKGSSKVAVFQSREKSLVIEL